MFTDADIKQLTSRRTLLLLSGLGIGAFAILAFFGLLVFVRESVTSWLRLQYGVTVAEFAPFAMILLGLGFFLTPAIVAEWLAKPYEIICPHCSANLTLRGRQILKTRCCKECRKRIVAGGKIRGPQVYARYKQRGARQFLVFWFWVWPALATIVLFWNWLDPTAFSRCIHMLFVPGLIGTAACGWAVIRTRDRRYWPQLVVSAVCFIVGGVVFWEAFW